MKRFNKTTVALATAGALTLGAVPAAVAAKDDNGNNGNAWGGLHRARKKRER